MRINPGLYTVTHGLENLSALRRARSATGADLLFLQCLFGQRHPPPRVDPLGRCDALRRHRRAARRRRARAIDSEAWYQEILERRRETAAGTAEPTPTRDEEKAAEVEKNRKAGDEVGVSGTPAFFINGRLLSGAQPLDAFKALIDEELKAK